MLVARIYRKLDPKHQNHLPSIYGSDMPPDYATPIKHNITLPPEIWVVIFEWAFEHFRAPALDFQDAKFVALGYGVFIGSNDDWRSIRLVCRAWLALAGPFRHVCLGQKSRQLHARVRSIELAESFGHSADEFLRLINSPVICPQLATISLIEAHLAVVKPPLKPLTTIDLFLGKLSSFKMLRSLSIRFFNNQGSFQPFWTHLAQGCPLLLNLAIYDCILPPSTDEIAFEHLERFIVRSLVMKNIPWFRLPSLKHLAVLSNPFGLSQVLKDHGSQLQTLWICIHYLNEDFWSHLPNLLHLEIQCPGLESIHPPPHVHPLRHLHINHLTYNVQDEDGIRGLLESFSHIPNLCVSDIQIRRQIEEPISQLASAHNAVFVATPLPPKASIPKPRARRHAQPGYPWWTGCLFFLFLPFILVAFLLYEGTRWLFSRLRTLWDLLVNFCRKEDVSQTEHA